MIIDCIRRLVVDIFWPHLTHFVSSFGKNWLYLSVHKIRDDHRLD